MNKYIAKQYYKLFTWSGTCLGSPFDSGEALACENNECMSIRNSFKQIMMIPEIVLSQTLFLCLLVALLLYM